MLEFQGREAISQPYRFDLELVSERDWGGLALTLFIFAAVVLLGMPLSIVFTIMQLPLMQRHALPEEDEEKAKG